MAGHFKQRLAECIKAGAAQHKILKNGDICGLLKVGCEEIVERTPENEDTLRRIAFSRAAASLVGPRSPDSIHTSTEFRELLSAHPEICKEVYIQILNGPDPVSAPANPPAKRPRRPEPSSGRQHQQLAAVDMREDVLVSLEGGVELWVYLGTPLKTN
jgi:hypothetical protein